VLAIQHKVTFKELRVPQDAFCGYHFSASMPGQVVKEAMQNMHQESVMMVSSWLSMCDHKETCTQTMQTV